jgi:hypothetical protein
MAPLFLSHLFVLSLLCFVSLFVCVPPFHIFGLTTLLQVCFSFPRPSSLSTTSSRTRAEVVSKPFVRPNRRTLPGPASNKNNKLAPLYFFAFNFPIKAIRRNLASLLCHISRVVRLKKEREKERVSCSEATATFSFISLFICRRHLHLIYYY